MCIYIYLCIYIYIYMYMYIHIIIYTYTYIYIYIYIYMHMHLYTCIFMCIYQNCSQRSNALYPQIGTHRPMEPTHMPIQAIILIKIKNKAQ